MTTLTAKITPYIALTRLDKPVGIWLLFWPCVWGIGLASGSALPDITLLILFFIGAVVMRSAGCVVNDMADRNFDGNVERTKDRPLASGALSMKQASACLAILLLIALLIVLQLPTICLYMAIAVLPLVAAYPFMKRITWWPQAFLGITFNSGTLFGWAAVTDTIELPAILLYLAGIFWTLGYDTIYAHQDKEDDALIGVKSTARKLGKYNRVVIAGFYGLVIFMLFLISIYPDPTPVLSEDSTYYLSLAETRLSDFYYPCFTLAALLLAWQVITAKFDDGKNCHRRFVSNQWVGAIIAIGCVVG